MKTIHWYQKCKITGMFFFSQSFCTPPPFQFRHIPLSGTSKFGPERLPAIPGTQSRYFSYLECPGGAHNGMFFQVVTICHNITWPSNPENIPSNQNNIPVKNNICPSNLEDISVPKWMEHFRGPPRTTPHTAGGCWGRAQLGHNPLWFILWVGQ